MVPFPHVAFHTPPVKLIQFQRVSPGPAPRESLGLRSHSKWKSLVRVGMGRPEVGSTAARADTAKVVRGRMDFATMVMCKWLDSMSMASETALGCGVSTGFF